MRDRDARSRCAIGMRDRDARSGWRSGCHRRSRSADRVAPNSGLGGTNPSLGRPRTVDAARAGEVGQRSARSPGRSTSTRPRSTRTSRSDAAASRASRPASTSARWPSTGLRASCDLIGLAVHDPDDAGASKSRRGAPLAQVRAATTRVTGTSGQIGLAVNQPATRSRRSRATCIRTRLAWHREPQSARASRCIRTRLAWRPP